MSTQATAKDASNKNANELRSVRSVDSSTVISVVLPLLNEEAILASLVGRVVQSISDAGYRYQIILVNDGSTDGSARVINELAQHDPNIVAVHLSRNFGHQSALLAGLGRAIGAAVVIMDSDGQDDPDAIPRMIHQWCKGFDVVNAVRASRQEAMWKRLLFSGFYRILNCVSNIPIQRDCGNFGLVDQKVAGLIIDLIENDRFYPGQRAWVGFEQTSIPVDRLKRHDDQPRVNLRGLISLAKTALFGFSRVPLHAFYWLAMLSALVSISCISFAVFHKVVTGLAIPGWASVTSSTAFFGAINALGIAILGEYITRIYDQVRSRPKYIISRVVSSADDQVVDLLESQLLQQTQATLASIQPSTSESNKTSRELV